jgi:hypothetical protein
MSWTSTAQSLSMLHKKVLKRDKIDQKHTDSALSEKRKTTSNNYTQEKNLIERKKMAECSVLPYRRTQIRPIRRERRHK